jgi:hypothetical protein
MAGGLTSSQPKSVLVHVRLCGCVENPLRPHMVHTAATAAITWAGAGTQTGAYVCLLKLTLQVLATGGAECKPA